MSAFGEMDQVQMQRQLQPPPCVMATLMGLGFHRDAEVAGAAHKCMQAIGGSRRRRYGFEQVFYAARLIYRFGRMSQAEGGRNSRRVWEGGREEEKVFLGVSMFVCV